MKLGHRPLSTVFVENRNDGIVWGPDGKGKAGGEKTETTDNNGNVVKSPDALERDYKSIRVSVLLLYSTCQHYDVVARDRLQSRI